MSRGGKEIDSIFAWIVAILVIGGFFIFISASLGLMAQEKVAFSKVVFNQIFFGVLGGTVALLITTRIPYKYWRKYGFYLFCISLVISALVFVPQLGFSHGGARRWISIGSVSLQPAEILKLGFVIYLSAWFASVSKKIHTFKYGFLPLIILLGLVALILLPQPDTGTFLVISLTGIGMYIVAGAPWRYIFAIAGLGLFGFAGLIVSKPYIKERLLTFLHPASDPLGAGYQIQQSLIAIGSGQITGRGMGQSIQKFNFLPEPIGDSIFAVFAEEWGFIGVMLLLTLFLAFALRGLKIASRAPDHFSRLLVCGIIFLIAGQSFINMAAMLGLAPLTGMPLIFISKGGTALLFALASVGIILNVSKYQKKYS